MRCGEDTTQGGTFSGSQKTFNGCFALCDDTAGCGAWTYVDGNCYLKIGFSSYEFQSGAASLVAAIRSTPVPSNNTNSGSSVPSCPSINSTTMTDSNGASYSISCGGDSQGSLITTFNANGGGISACLTACDNTESCTAFTYSGDSTMTQGTCYLKYDAGPTSSGGPETIALGILVQPASGGTASSQSSVVVAASSSMVAASSVASVAVSSSPVATASSGGAAASSAGAATTPLPSGGGSPTVVNPDGSTSTYNGLLASPTRCDFGDPINTEEDDSYCEVDVPFSMKMYQGSSSRTFPSTNGVSKSNSFFMFHHH
jgi:hypothetical protein